MPIKENKRFSLLSAVLLMLLLAAWACSYVQLHMYQNMCDESYQIMCGWDYRSSVAAPLSAWLTSAIGPLWNFDNSPFRIIGWTLQIIATLISMLPTWWMSRNINFTLAAGSVSISLFSMCRCLEPTFCWDSYAVPALMAVVALCISYSIKRKWWKIVAMGVCCGVLSMLRLPSAVAIVLPATCLLLVDGLSGRAAKRICGLLAAYAITVFGILTSLYGSTGLFLDMLSSNLISAHDPGALSNIYVAVLNMLCLYALGAAGLLFILNKSITCKTCLTKTLMSAICAAVGFYIFIRVAIDGFFWYYAYLFSSVYIVTEMYLAWRTTGKMRICIIMVLLASLLGGFGSNIIVARFVIFPTMPLVLYCLAQTISSRAKAAALAALWIPILITNHVFTTDLFFKFDNGHARLTSGKTSEIPHLHGMWISKYEKERVQCVADRFLPFVNDTTYNTAVMRNTPNDFMFEYIFDSRSPVYSHCWDWEPLMLNKDYTDRFTRWIEQSKRPVAVLMVRYVNTIDGPEEDIIREYKQRYRTVYSDRNFTIIICEPQITSMSDSSR